MRRLTFGETLGGLIAFLPVVLAQAQVPADQSPLDVVLALDNSGSMASSDHEFLLRGAVSGFAAGLRPTDQCALVIFGDGSRLALPLKARADPDFGEALDGSLQKLNYREQYTDIPGGFAAALLELRERGRKSAQHVIVLFTDGFVDLRDRSQIAGRKEWLQQGLRSEAAEKSVRVFGIAFTDTADLQLLQSLATATQGDYKRVDRAVNLEEALAEIREEMSMPPARSSGGLPSPSPQRPPVEPPPGGAIWNWLAPLVAVVVAGLAAIIAYSVLLRRQRAAETIPVGQRAVLRLCTGTGQAIEISTIRTLIGRKATSDIVLDEPTISQPHASIEFRSGGFYLRDMRSTNGTFVHRENEGDAHRVDSREEEPLKHGDIIRFGGVRSFIFETEEGGLTDVSRVTKKVPIACCYHSTRPAAEYCRVCRRALCAECFASHPCRAGAETPGD